MAVVEPYLDDIDQVARAGFDTYRRYGAKFRIEHSKRAAAGNIYDHMIAEAERRFLDRDGIKLLDVRGLKVWLIGTDAVLRFKKMDHGGRFRRYSTKQADAYDFSSNRFDNQDDLPGIPPAAVRVAAGYLLDSSGTKFIRTQVARPIKRRRVSWCTAVIPVDERQAGQPIWYEVTRQRRLL